MYRLPWHWDFPKLLGVVRRTDERRRFVRQIPVGSQHKIKRLKSNSATSCIHKLHGITYRRNSITKSRRRQFKPWELSNIKSCTPIALIEPNVSLFSKKSRFQKDSLESNFIFKEYHTSVTIWTKSMQNDAIKNLERELQQSFLKSEVDSDNTIQKYCEDDDDPRKKKRRRLDLYLKPLDYLPNTHIPELTTIRPVKTKSQSDSAIHANLEKNVTNAKLPLDDKSNDIKPSISQTEKHHTAINLITNHDTTNEPKLHVEDNKPLLNIEKLEPKLIKEKSRLDVGKSKSFDNIAKERSELAPDAIPDFPSKAGKSELKELKEALEISFLKSKDDGEKLQKKKEDPHHYLKKKHSTNNKGPDYSNPTPEQPILIQPSRDLSDLTYATRNVSMLGRNNQGANINTTKQSLETEQNEIAQSLPTKESKLDASYAKSNVSVTKSKSDSKIYSSNHSVFRQSLKNLPRFFYRNQQDETQSDMSQNKSKRTESQSAISERQWYKGDKGTIFSYIKEKLRLWMRSQNSKEKIQTPLLGPGPIGQEKQSYIGITQQHPRNTISGTPKSSKPETQTLKSTQNNNLSSLNSSLPTPVSRTEVSLNSSVPAPESRTSDTKLSMSSESSSLKSPQPAAKFETTNNSQPVITISVSTRPSPVSQETSNSQRSSLNSSLLAPISQNSYNTQPVILNSSIPASVAQTSYNAQPVTFNYSLPSHVSQTSYNTPPAISQYSQQWQPINALQSHQTGQDMYYPQSGTQAPISQPYYRQKFVPIGNPTTTAPQSTWNSSIPWNSSVSNPNIQSGGWQNFHGQSSYYPVYDNQFNNQNNLATHSPAVQYTHGNTQLKGEPTFGNFGGQTSNSFSSTNLPSASPATTLGQLSSSAVNPYSSAPAMPFSPAPTLGLPTYSRTNAYSVPVPATNPYNIPLQSVSVNEQLGAVKNSQNVSPQSVATSGEPSKPCSPMPYNMSPIGMPTPPFGNFVDNNTPSVSLPFPFPASLPVINYYSAPCLPPGSTPGSLTPTPTPGAFTNVNTSSTPTSGPFISPTTFGPFTPTPTSRPFIPTPTSGLFPPNLTSGQLTSTPTSGQRTPTPISGPFTPTPTSIPFTPTPSSIPFTPTPTSGLFTPKMTSGQLTSNPISGSFTPTPTSGQGTPTPVSGPFTPTPTSMPFTPTPTSGPFTPTQTTTPFTFSPTSWPFTPNSTSISFTPTSELPPFKSSPTSETFTSTPSGSCTPTPTFGTFTPSKDGPFATNPQANSCSVSHLPSNQNGVGSNGSK